MSFKVARQQLGRIVLVEGLCCCLLAMSTVPSEAQIKPATSGQPSFEEPEMKRHGSGLYRPNAPKRRLRRNMRREP